MQANEFVKKFGLERARAASKMHIADFCRCFDLPMSFLIDMRDDLERLVESHELVESYGGISELRREKILAWELNMPRTYELLRKAIADVESCK